MTVIVDGKRPCIMCEEMKSLDQFYRCRYVTAFNNPSVRYDSRCKACNRKRRRERHAADPGKGREQSLAWRARNHEAMLRYRRAYDRSEHGHKVKARNQRRRKHRLRGLGTYNHDDIQQILRDQKGRCAGCTAKILKTYTIDHIVPISKGGTNERRNLQLLCVGCNSRKATKHASEWYRESGRLL